MNTTPTPRRHRTIGMSEARSRMLACIAAYMNTTSEVLIQSAITAMLISVCENDRVLSYVVARAGGADWRELEADQHSDVLERITP